MRDLGQRPRFVALLAIGSVLLVGGLLLGQTRHFLILGSSNTAETLDDIPAAMQREITHFFSVYKQLEGKDVDVDGWRSREEALDVIADGRKLQMEYDAPRRS